MPVKNLPPTDTTAKHYKSISYETLAASWLLNDGWETYLPLVDHGMKTDLIIADGNNFYRIQIKSVVTNDECFVVDNPFTDAVNIGQGEGAPGPSGPPGRWAPVHYYNLTQAGVHQIQNANLKAMVDDSVWLSCTMILPLLVEGGTGSPVRPIAIGAP